MAAIGGILLGLGAVLAVIGSIWLLIAAFRQSIWWGLGSILLPLVWLIFVILNWDEAQKPFLCSLAGGILGGIGYYIIFVR